MTRDEWTPPIETYMALAHAMHNEDEGCNANYYLPFSECGTPEFDISQAIKVLVGLRKAGWMLVHDPAGTLPLGLVG